MRRTPGCEQQIGGCYDRFEYVDQIMMGSDTTIGVLSGISYTLGADGTEGFAVLNNEDLLDGAMKLQVDFPNRILTHAMVMPNDRIDVQLAMMDRTAGTYTNWKTYPPWTPSPRRPGLLARRNGRPEHGRAADDPARTRPQVADLLHPQGLSAQRLQPDPHEPARRRSGRQHVPERGAS